LREQFKAGQWEEALQSLSWIELTGGADYNTEVLARIVQQQIKQQQKMVSVFKQFHLSLYKQARMYYNAGRYPEALQALQLLKAAGGMTKNVERLISYLERVVARERVTPGKKPLWVRLMPGIVVFLGFILGIYIYYIYHLLNSLAPP
jgi:hypothetical protein